LPAGLLGPVLVVVAGVRAGDRPQVAFTVDEDQVGAPGSCGALPPLGIAVRTWVRGGVLTTFMPSLAKISSNAAVNLMSRSRMRTRKESVPSVRS